MNPFIKISEQYYVRHDAAVVAGIASKRLYKRSQSNRDKWGIIKDPNDAKANLYSWDHLKEDDQELITDHYHGTPAEWLAMQPIRNMIQPVPGAEDFYLTYRYDLNGKQTPLGADLITKYSRNVQVLDMLKKAWEEKKKGGFKKTWGFGLDEFVDQVIKVIISDGYDLPTKYPTLISKPESPFKRYLKEGFAGLISKKVGNINTQKVTAGECEAKLLNMIAHPNQYDDVMTCYLYNGWAGQNGHKAITPRTVTHWRLEREHEIMMQREGNSAFNEKYIRQVKGIKPTQPLYLVECDDYNLNYYFEEPETKNRLARYVSYCVVDSNTGLLLGKCYRPEKSPTFEMVRLAWIDAMRYIKRLTGGWYLPFEVKADHWQKANAFPFFEKIGKFVPPAHANKHRGYLEQLFGSAHLKRAEKLSAHKDLNYNGNNITATNWGVNTEVLNANGANRRLVGQEADEQVEKFFYALQKMPAFTRNDMNAPSKEQQFMERWNSLPDSEKRPISDEQFLMIFGLAHNPDRPITITNRGVEPTILGQEYSYDMPDYVRNIDWIGAKAKVYYDPYDMSRVLVTDGDKIRFVATDARLSARALEDTSLGSRTVLNAILGEKKAQVSAMGNKASQREQFGYLDPEAAMLGAYVPKELKNMADKAIENTPGREESDWDAA